MSGNDTATENSINTVSLVKKRLMELGLHPVQQGKSVLSIGEDYIFKIHSQFVSGTADEKLVNWVCKLYKMPYKNKYLFIYDPNNVVKPDVIDNCNLVASALNTNVKVLYNINFDVFIREKL